MFPTEKTKPATAANMTSVLLLLILSVRACEATAATQTSFAKPLIMPSLGAENYGLDVEQKAKYLALKDSFLAANYLNQIQYRSDRAIQVPTNASLVEEKNVNDIISLSLGVDQGEISDLNLEDEKQAVIFTVNDTAYTVVKLDDTDGNGILMFFGSNDHGKTWSQSLISKGPAIIDDEDIQFKGARAFSYSSPEDFQKNFGGLATPNTINEDTSISYLLINPYEKNSEGKLVPPDKPTVAAVAGDGQTTFLIKPEVDSLIDGLNNISKLQAEIPQATATDSATATQALTETTVATTATEVLKKTFEIEEGNPTIIVDTEVEGVHITGSLISHEDVFHDHEIKLSEAAIANLMVEAIFSGFKANGLDNSNISTEITSDDKLLRKYFMEQLAIAQKPENLENEAQWQKVAFNTFDDSIGKMVEVYPLRNGSNITMFITNANLTPNLVDMRFTWKQAQGTNINGNSIIIAFGMPVGAGLANENTNSVASGLSVLAHILSRNTTFPIKTDDKAIMAELIGAGLDLK